ncbi:flippase [Fodinibius salsisoli]|uniref:Flippase n=1 Tax=Fodinibius salsisoli TaxID=2820877 RepID=A0ABT3PJC8_9BACT|nr:flippase [Fodinibius salsisoli]MCW9706042.1 flippase [Fodinibius salsisoli]
MNSSSSHSSSKQQGILGQNTLINIMGRGIPLLFAVVAIPFVIDGLGTERFGVLTIVWIVIGYFGLFDMGLGRATTKFVADQEARGADQLSPIILTSIFLLIGLGIIGGGIIVIATPYLVQNILNIPSELIGETTQAFYVLSISIPLVLGSIGARGALEAQQRFGIVNLIKVPASIINYVGPLLVLPFSNQLQHVVIVLVIARAVTFVMYLFYCLKNDLNLRLDQYPVLQWVKELLSFGAWITVSNLISPLMVYIDRFILGAMMTMTAVAYYTTPYEMVTRLLMVSGSFMGVMFPAFSVYSLKKKEKLTALHQKSIRYLLLVLVPIITFLVLSAEPLLYYWIGDEFAQNSTHVLQLLGIGVLINSIAAVPYTMLQAIGRPDITAKLHMAELPVYLAMIWFLTQAMGITGVALAWVLRVTIDAGLLLFFSNRLVGFISQKGNAIQAQVWGFTVCIIVSSAILFIFDNRNVLLGIGIVMGVAVFLAIWKFTLKPGERSRLLELYRQLKTKIFHKKIANE